MEEIRGQLNKLEPMLLVCLYERATKESLLSTKTFKKLNFIFIFCNNLAIKNLIIFQGCHGKHDKVYKRK